MTIWTEIGDFETEIAIWKKTILNENDYFEQKWRFGRKFLKTDKTGHFRPRYTVFFYQG